eukprot:GAHX01001101.1.p1 GENE.GAHX01001101.1~~GAHX01001101.1.p1  ORF type:complete len:782 (-),score=183.72 GAHX01001101.1:149-2494(-)
MSKSDLLFPTTKAKAVAANYNRKLLAVALYDGSVIFINVAAKRIIHSIHLSKKPIRTLQFIEGTSKVICGSDTGEIIIYDASAQETVYRKVISSEYIRKIVVHGKVLFVGSDDGSVKVYFIKDIHTTSLKYYTELKGCDSYVMDLKIYNNRLFVGYLNGNINVYELETLNLSKQLQLDTKNLNSFELYCENEALTIFAGFDNGVLVKTNYTTSKSISFNFKELKMNGNIVNVKTNKEDKTIEIYTDTGINYTTEIDTFSIPTTSIKATEKLKRSLIGFSVQIGCVWDVFNSNSRTKKEIGIGYVVHVGENGVLIQLEKKPEFIGLRLTDSVLLVIYGLEIYRLNLADQNNVKSINVDNCLQSKNFTKIGDISSFPNRAFISSSGRYVCLVFNKRFAVYTTRTFIKKLEGDCEDVVFLNEDIVVLDSVVSPVSNEKPYSTVNVFKGFELESTLKLENKSVVKLFGGRMLGVHYKTEKKSFFELFTDSEYTSITTLPGIVEKVVWGNSENDVILISKTFSYIIKLTPENENEKMKVIKEVDTQSIGFVNDTSFLYNFTSIKCSNYELNNISYILDSLDENEVPVLYNKENETLLIENKEKRTFRQISMSREWININLELVGIFYSHKQMESLSRADKNKIVEILNTWNIEKFNKLEQFKIEKVKTFLEEQSVSIKELLEKETLYEEDRHMIELEGIDSYVKEIVDGNKVEEIKKVMKHGMFNSIKDKYIKIEILNLLQNYDELKKLGKEFKENGDALEAKMCFILCGKSNKGKKSFKEIISCD